MGKDDSSPPFRQVRAVFDETTLTVYQAYPPQIADAALAAGTFVAPFKLDRMTWIKPSFLWMMYRSGWATKTGQERILAIRVYRECFDHALSGACLSHYDPAVHASHDEWKGHLRHADVRVQWDPERSLHGDPLPWRCIQVGLGGTAVRAYVSEWTSGIGDVTRVVHDIRQLLTRYGPEVARRQLPVEAPYPLPEPAARVIGGVDEG